MEKCPYMTAHCPHYKGACLDSSGKDCHHVKVTTASKMIARTLQAIGGEKLSSEMKEYLRQAVHVLE